MSGALIVLGGIVYIALSLVFRLTPRLRVVIGLVVGGMLTGVVAKQVDKWLATGIEKIAGPVGRWIGQGTQDVAVAIPSAIAFGLAVTVIVFLRRKGGGGAAGGKGAAGKGAGGGRAGGLANIALGCALLLPIVAGSIGEAIRGVSA